MNRGGAETTVMNLYRAANHLNIQFDFLTIYNDKGDFDDEIVSMGGQVHHISHILKVGYLRFRKEVEDFFTAHTEYKIVHCHMNEWAGLFLSIAKKYGVAGRIAHSHSTGFLSHGWKDILFIPFRNYMKSKVNSSANVFIACGYDAGRWLFGKKTARDKMRILLNVRSIEQFCFNQDMRLLVRNELEVTNDTLLLSHIGSFTKAKNHYFLLQILKDIQKVRKAKLVLVGVGPYTENIKTLARSMAIIDDILFLGLRSDVCNLLQGFDILLLPSIIEGLPSVVVEAQAASLPSVVSTFVTTEVDVGMGIVEFVSINSGTEKWTSAILSLADKTIRPRSTQSLYDFGYDADEAATDYYKLCKSLYADLTSES